MNDQLIIITDIFLDNCKKTEENIKYFKNKDQSILCNVLYKTFYEEFLKCTKFRFSKHPIHLGHTFCRSLIVTRNDMKILKNTWIKNENEIIEKIDKLIEFLLDNVKTMRDNNLRRYNTEFKYLSNYRIHKTYLLSLISYKLNVFS